MKNTSLKVRIAGGFAGLIALCAGLGILATANMRTASKSADQLAHQFVPESDIASRLGTAIAKANLAIRSYGFTAEDKYLTAGKSALAESEKELRVAAELAAKYTNLVKLRQDLQTITPLLGQYEEAVAQTESKNKDILADREAMNAQSTKFLKDLDELSASQHERLNKEIRDFAEVEKLSERAKKIRLVGEIIEEANLGRVAVFKAQAIRDPSLVDDALKRFATMDAKFEEIRPLLRVPADLQNLEDVKKGASSYRTAVEGLKANLISLDQITRARGEIGAKVGDACDEVVQKGMERTVSAADSSSVKLNFSSTVVTSGLVVAIIAGILLTIFITRSTNKVLTHVSTLLDESSSQVASAASQVSSASQSLAEGASEQAASLEETSASLEEMASMTNRNAENAETARQLANQTRTAADSGSAEMKKMIAAMDAIKSSSDNIGKIIKTIDEIAFQTNILALNAAVEAARAGEAGMGFAVVADEVRNLAQRSAQAAHETAERIEDSIRKSEQGVQISATVAESLDNIVTKARKVDELVGEIASASREQSQGIQQVNTAVTQMDKVTQSNAASAEESASASEELNAQAAAMKEAVGHLLTLVSGTDHTNDHKAAIAAPPKRKPAAPTRNGVVVVSRSKPSSARSVTLSLTDSEKEAELPMQAVN